MSYIPKFAPKELSTILEAMREFPPDKVELAYRNREITLKEKLVRLQLYGQAQREAQISSTVAEAQAKEGTIQSLGAHGMGELKYYFQGVAKEYKAAWDSAVGQQQLSDVVKGTVVKPDPAKAVFHAMMGSLELLGAYDLPGDIVERWSLEMFPDSPGLARAMNWAVWMPTNLFGISAMLKAPFMAAGSTARAVVKAGDAASDFVTYLKDPVAYVVKAAKSQDALLASKVARAQAENTVRKGAGVAGAAIEAESKSKGSQVVTGAETVFRGHTQSPFTEARHGEFGTSFSLDKDIAKKFGNEIESFTLDPAAKVISFEDAAKEYAESIVGQYDKAMGVKSSPKTVTDLIENMKKAPGANLEAMSSFIKAGGKYDAIDLSNLAAPFRAEKEIRILNSKSLLTPTTKGNQPFTVAQPLAGTPGAIPAPAFASPQDLEKLTVTELIKHYEQRAVGMIRSSTYDEPIKKGFTRLYRGESKPVVLTEEFKKANQDATAVYGQSRWFTKELESAKFYGNETGKLTYVDVPTSSLESLKASNQAISKNFVRDANTEFFLSPELVQQRKSLFGGVSHAETKASATPFSIEEIAARAPDAPISATELESIGMVHEQVSKAFNAVLDDASKYIDDIAAGNRSDLVQAYKAHLAAMAITNPAFLSARGQTGRGLEYMKTMQDLVGESKIFDTLTRALGSEKLLEGSNEAIAYTMRKVFELGKMERAKLTELAASEAYKTPTLRLIYKSLLFARPGIHAANILGNIDSIMLHGVNKSVSAVMPWSETTWREAGAYWTGMWEAKSKWGELWRRATERQSSALSKAGIEGTATGTLVSKGPLGWLGFEDELMIGVLEQGLAKSRAITEGLAKWDELQNAVKAGAFTLPAGTNKKKWLADFVDSAMTDPMNYERLIKQTEKEADYIIFRSPLSHGGELVAKGIRESVFDYLAPVVKFPINSMKMARDWTPGLQMLSKDFMEAVAEGGARADAARARMTISWMISSQVYEGAKAGIIMGDGPLNPQSNAIWRAAGNTPRTIHGVPIQWAEPFGTWFAFIADLAHNGAEMDEENLSNAFQAVMTSGLQAIENNYFLRIAEGVTNSISDFKRVTDLNDILGGAGKLIAQPVKTLVTGGTVGRVVGETINPERPDMKIYGELKDLKNWFFASTPFGADTRPRLNYSGKVEMVPPMLGAQWIKDNLGAPDWFARGVTALFEPSMRTNIGEDDPVAQFLAKHELTLHDNWKYYGTGANPGSPLPSRIDENNPRVNLTGDQAFTWKHLALNKAKEYGADRTWVQAIQALDADPDFINAPLYEKQQEVNRLYGTFRADALEALKMSDPTLAAKEAQALITPEVNVQTSDPMMEAVQ